MTNEEKIIKLLGDIKTKQKKDKEEIMKAIKKNRTTIIKKAFDKKLISSMLESNLELKVEMVKKLEETKQDLIKVTDKLIDRVVKKIKIGLIQFLGLLK